LAFIIKDNTYNAAHFAETHNFPCPIFGLDESAKSKWGPLVERIKTAIGRQPEVYALTAYDALWVLALSAVSAGKDTGITNMKNIFVLQASNFFGVTGNTRLNENGDRAEGNYDFWAIRPIGPALDWRKTAQYNSATGVLTRYMP
jgi:branched-chain amino acid transport system substrate-binding protein